MVLDYITTPKEAIMLLKNRLSFLHVIDRVPEKEKNLNDVNNDEQYRSAQQLGIDVTARAAIWTFCRRIYDPIS